MVQRAFHDPLTGLPNAAYLKRETQAAVLTAASRIEAKIAVLLVLAGRVQGVRRIFGVETADELLKLVGERPVRTARGSAVARVDGDHKERQDAGNAEGA